MKRSESCRPLIVKIEIGDTIPRTVDDPMATATSLTSAICATHRAYGLTTPAARMAGITITGHCVFVQGM